MKANETTKACLIIDHEFKYKVGIKRKNKNARLQCEVYFFIPKNIKITVQKEKKKNTI